MGVHAREASGEAVSPQSLTIWVVGWLDAHVGLSFVLPRLPLAALLLQGRLRPALGGDVGQVCRGVVVRLHALVVLDLQHGRHGSNGQGRPLRLRHLADAVI